jgi:hypothetical protein
MGEGGVLLDAVAQRDLVERYIGAYNAIDVEGMMRTVHPRIEFRNVAGGEVSATVHGVAEFRALAEQTAELFTERRQTIVGFSSNGGRAVVDVTWEAVLARDIPDIGSEGDRLELRGRSEFEFCDGLIVHLVDES